MKNDKLKGQITYLIVGIVMLVALFIWYKTKGFYYGINDDITMHNIASGKITGTPDGHIVFIKYTLGLVISKLFTLFPMMDWYGIVLIGFCVGCLYLILCRVIFLTKNHKDKNLIRLIFFTIITVIFCELVVFFQFTLVAGVLSATAVFFLVTAEKKTLLFDFLLAILLLLFGVMVRTKVAYMMLPAFLLALVIRIKDILLENTERINDLSRLKSNIINNKKYLVKLGIIMFVGIISLIGIWKIEHKAYSDSQWSRYTSYKTARSLITDYFGWPDYENNRELWDSIGISKEERDCISMYGILPNMNEEKISVISNYARQKDYNEPISIYFSKGLELINNVISSDNNRILMIIFVHVLFAVIILKNMHYVRKTELSAFIITQLLVLIYILYMGRFPDRVALVFELECTMLSLGCILNLCRRHVTNPNEIMNNRVFSNFEFVLISIIILGIAYGRINDRVSDYRSQLTNYTNICDYIDSKDIIAVVTTGTTHAKKRFTVKEYGKTIKTVGTGGWSVYSPWEKTKYEQLGLQRENNILMDDRIYLLSNSIEKIDKLNTYFISNGSDGYYSTVDQYTSLDGVVLYLVKW